MGTLWEMKFPLCHLGRLGAVAGTLTGRLSRLELSLHGGNLLRLAGILLVLALEAEVLGLGLESLVLVLVGFGLPIANVVLGVAQDLTRLCTVLVGDTRVSGHDWGVVEELQEAAAMLGQDDLLLGSLNCGSELAGVRCLEFLTSLFTHTN